MFSSQPLIPLNDSEVIPQQVLRAVSPEPPNCLFITPPCPLNVLHVATSICIDIGNTVIHKMPIAECRQRLTVGPPLITQYSGSNPDMVKDQRDKLLSGPSLHQTENRLKSIVSYAKHSKNPFFSGPPTSNPVKIQKKNKNTNYRLD